MTPIVYRTGDSTAPDAPGNKIIVHVCNDRGGWGKGFVLAISRRWPEPEAAYRRWYTERQHNDFALGAVQFVPVEDGLWIANLIGQRGYRRDNHGSPPVRYEAIAEGLARVAEFALAQDASVHMPRIGCGLAGGDWAVVSGLIEKQLTDRNIAVTVYDLA